MFPMTIISCIMVITTAILLTFPVPRPGYFGMTKMFALLTALFFIRPRFGHGLPAVLVRLDQQVVNGSNWFFLTVFEYF